MKYTKKQLEELVEIQTQVIQLLLLKISQLDGESEKDHPTSYSAYFSQGRGGVPGCSCD